MRIEIEICDYDNYDPKRNQKTYTWARIDNDLADSQDLFGLDHTTRYVWVLLLCQASKRGSHKFFLDIEWLTHVTGIPSEKILSSVAGLVGKGLIGKRDPNQPDLPVQTDGAEQPRNTAELSGAPVAAPESTTPTNGRTDVMNGRTDGRSFNSGRPSFVLKPAPCESPSQLPPDMLAAELRKMGAKIFQCEATEVSA